MAQVNGIMNTHIEDDIRNIRSLQQGSPKDPLNIMNKTIINNTLESIKEIPNRENGE
jgi:hypothetical protein